VLDKLSDGRNATRVSYGAASEAGIGAAHRSPHMWGTATLRHRSVEGAGIACSTVALVQRGGAPRFCCGPNVARQLL